MNQKRKIKDQEKAVDFQNIKIFSKNLLQNKNNLL